LKDLRKARADDLLVGALSYLRAIPQHLSDYEAAAKRLGDPWFIAYAELHRATAQRKTGDAPGAELRLLQALASCKRANLELRCAQLESELAHLYTVEHRLTEARTHALAGLELARRLNEWGVEGQFLEHLGNIAQHSGSYPMARAFLLEQGLRTPDHCEIQSYVQEMIAHAYLNELDVPRARAELARVPLCGKPPGLTYAMILAELARHSPPEAEQQRFDEAVSALRAREDLGAGEKVFVKNLEGRARLEKDRAVGAKLLREVIADAAQLGPSNGPAQQARAHAYAALLLDAGKHQEYASALQLFAEEKGGTPPARCALAVEVQDERVLVVARGPDGKDHGDYRADRKSKGFDPSKVVPPPLIEVLRGCDSVQVLARTLVHGHAGLLPPQLAWSYALPRAAPASKLSQPRRLVVTDVESPPALALPRLRSAEVSTPHDLTLRGAEATPDRVLRELEEATEAELHVHGMINPGVSDASFLVLSPDAAGRYALTAADLKGRALRGAPVVYLGACRAAYLAPYVHQAWGLPTAFLEAGARAVVAALTDVPDAQAGPFFERVRGRVAQGEAPAVAVRNERLAALDKGQTWVTSVIVFE
jgi:hypothetical protein